jgi:hypothetical protein
MNCWKLFLLTFLAALLLLSGADVGRGQSDEGPQAWNSS